MKQPDSETPCIGVCIIEDNGIEDICIGCGRNLKEIERWSTYSDADKIEINGQALIRLQND